MVWENVNWNIKTRVEVDWKVTFDRISSLGQAVGASAFSNGTTKSV